MSVIQVNSIGKHYKRYPNRWSRLAEWLGSKNSRHEKHWVLRDVSFDVRAGESIGIIGHNGAGKSTLLKLITGTTQPSTGSATVTGRVAALLELGMGFHPDFAGRQNAYMSGQLLGYSNEEIAARMHDIEAFAEIGDYIDQPVRTYSSGMQVRLAFSVATFIRPDVLIVDEALSVGDVFFQQKCFERIRLFREAGTTLLFVSHALGTIYALCDRAILLDHGRLVCDADPKTVVDLYQRRELEQMNARASTTANPMLPAAGPAEPPDVTGQDSGEAPSQMPALEPDFATGLAEICSVALLCDGTPTAAVVSDAEITLRIAVTAHADIEDPHIGFQIRNARGEPIFMTNSYCMGKTLGALSRGAGLVAEYTMKCNLAPGDYTVTAGVANGGHGEIHFREALARRHGVAKFTVVLNRLGIRWAGVCNLQPQLCVSRSSVLTLSTT